MCVSFTVVIASPFSRALLVSRDRLRLALWLGRCVVDGGRLLLAGQEITQRHLG